MLVGLVLLAFSVAALPAPATADEAFWRLIGSPGHAVLMRHAEAPGYGDPPGLRIGDCATQRNLDDKGRAQARRIGEALARRDVTFDRVLSSQWCRCLDTAELVAGRKPEQLASLNSFFGDRSVAPARVAAIKGVLRTLRAGERALLVTHQVVIQALTGTGTASGEMVLVRIGEGGAVELVARARVD